VREISARLDRFDRRPVDTLRRIVVIRRQRFDQLTNRRRKMPLDRLGVDLRRALDIDAPERARRYLRGDRHRRHGEHDR
jgi:hypothetical protein